MSFDSLPPLIYLHIRYLKDCIFWYQILDLALHMIVHVHTLDVIRKKVFLIQAILTFTDAIHHSLTMRFEEPGR